MPRSYRATPFALPPFQAPSSLASRSPQAPTFDRQSCAVRGAPVSQHPVLAASFSPRSPVLRHAVLTDDQWEEVAASFSPRSPVLRPSLCSSARLSWVPPQASALGRQSCAPGRRGERGRKLWWPQASALGRQSCAACGGCMDRGRMQAASFSPRSPVLRPVKGKEADKWMPSPQASALGRQSCAGLFAEPLARSRFRAPLRAVDASGCSTKPTEQGLSPQPRRTQGDRTIEGLPGFGTSPRCSLDSYARLRRRRSEAFEGRQTDRPWPCCSSPPWAPLREPQRSATAFSGVDAPGTSR